MSRSRYRERLFGNSKAINIAENLKIRVNYTNAFITAFPCPFLSKPHPSLFIYFSYVLAYVQAVRRKLNTANKQGCGLLERDMETRYLRNKKENYFRARMELSFRLSDVSAFAGTVL